MRRTVEDGLHDLDAACKRFSKFMEKPHPGLLTWLHAAAKEVRLVYAAACGVHPDGAKGATDAEAGEA